MKKQLSALSILLTFACAHSKKDSCCQKGEEKDVKAERVKGYGDFLFIPPDSIALRNFVDNDGDKTDDRYQMGPGQPGFPTGYYYKK